MWCRRTCLQILTMLIYTDKVLQSRSESKRTRLIHAFKLRRIRDSCRCADPEIVQLSWKIRPHTVNYPVLGDHRATWTIRVINLLPVGHVPANKQNLAALTSSSAVSCLYSYIFFAYVYLHYRSQSIDFIFVPHPVVEGAEWLERPRSTRASTGLRHHKTRSYTTNNCPVAMRIFDINQPISARDRY